MRIFVVLTALGLCACAAPVPVQTVSGPDGRPAYAMKCSGFGRHRVDCLEEAGKLCPAGYQVIDDSSEVSGAVVTRYAVIAGNRDYLTVECR